MLNLSRFTRFSLGNFFGIFDLCKKYDISQLCWAPGPNSPGPNLPGPNLPKTIKFGLFSDRGGGAIKEE